MWGWGRGGGDGGQDKIIGEEPVAFEKRLKRRDSNVHFHENGPV